MVCIKLKDGSRIIVENDGNILHFIKDGSGIIVENDGNISHYINIETLLVEGSGIFYDFVTSHYGEIDKIYSELNNWESKKYFNSDEATSLVNKVFHINENSIPAYKSIKQFLVFLKMFNNSKSFNVTCEYNDVFLIFFKPSDIVFRWFFQNGEIGGIHCSKEIDIDQLEMILCILKKEVEGL